MYARALLITGERQYNFGAGLINVEIELFRWVLEKLEITLENWAEFMAPSSLLAILSDGHKAVAMGSGGHPYCTKGAILVRLSRTSHQPRLWSSATPYAETLRG